MGLFDFFRKKKDEPSVEKPQTEIVKPEAYTSVAEEKQIAITEPEVTNFYEHFRIHPDIDGLVWIADGKYKNFINETKARIFEYEGYRISVSFSGDTEPSLIYTNMPVKQPDNVEGIQRPPYFPTYSGLSPEQKWIYLKLLCNPYDTSIDIGYVFILYYGLERHLLQGDFERASNVILKLRDVHRNGSFQSYSAQAVILSAMLHKRGEMITEFIKSLDKEYEFIFSENLFLICYYSFNMPLLPRDIMRMAKTFEFNNNNYIKKFPDIFQRHLIEALTEKYSDEKLFLNKILPNSEIGNLGYYKDRIFANMSIRDKDIPIPLICNNPKLKNDIFSLLETAHAKTKVTVAQGRKDGTIVEEPKKKTNVENKPMRKMFSIMTILPKSAWISKVDDQVLDGRESEGDFWINAIRSYKEFSDKRLMIAIKSLPLPAAFRECFIAIRAIIREKKNFNENVENDYKLLYKLGAVESMCTPYSEKKEQPGYNVMIKIPGGLLLKLPTQYEIFGYKRMEFTATDCKAFVSMWGEPKLHTTMNEYYHDIWEKYENKLRRL